MSNSPASFFTDFGFDGTYISFQLPSLRGLSAAEAHPTRGDWRDLVFSLCSTIQTYYNGLTLENRDPMLRVRDVQQYPSSVGDNAVRQTYSFEFTENIAMTNPDVVEE